MSPLIIVTIVSAMLGTGGLSVMVTAVAARRTSKATASQTYTDTALALIAAVKSDAEEARRELSETRREASDARRESDDARRTLTGIKDEIAKVGGELSLCSRHYSELIAAIRDPQVTIDMLRGLIEKQVRETRKEREKE